MGVAAQYASALGKTANCQTLLSLTLARGEVPVVGVAAVSSRELDEGAGPVGTSGCSGRVSNGADEAGVGFGGDRSCDRGRRALRLRLGGCRLWAQCAVSKPHGIVNATASMDDDGALGISQVVWQFAAWARRK